MKALNKIRFYKIYILVRRSDVEAKFVHIFVQRFATCCTKCSFSFKFLVDSVVLCGDFDALFELIEFDFLEYDNVKIFAVKIITVNFANKI